PRAGGGPAPFVGVAGLPPRLGQDGDAGEHPKQAGAVDPRQDANKEGPPGDRQGHYAPGAIPGPVRRVVRAEHERWDGTGYPDGLKGEEIPIEARIIHACDAYHAMASDRPYRQALTRPAILSELRNKAGEQFDPMVARTLLEVLASEEVAVTDHAGEMADVAPIITWTGPRSWAQHLEAIETLSARSGRITSGPEICRLI